MTTGKEKDFQSIPIDKINIDKWNVRTLDKEKGIEELVESILKYDLRKLAFECPAWKGGDEKCLLL